LLHDNPIGNGGFSWAGAVILALAVNFLFAFVVAPWAAPYVAGEGPQELGIDSEFDRKLPRTTVRLAVFLMGIGLIGVIAISLAGRELIITPSARLDSNAQLAKATIKASAPEEYQRALSSADTWKVSNNLFRTCVITPKNRQTAYCVLISTAGGKAVLRSKQIGLPNIEEFKRIHPDAVQK